MSVSFNQATIAGHLTRDPECKNIPSGSLVCDLGVAVNDVYKDKDGNKQERCDFIDVTYYGRVAEVIEQYCKKGDPILVSGKLRLDQWTTDDGQKRSKLKIIGQTMQMLGSKGGSDGGGQQSSQQNEPQHTGPQGDEPIPF